MTIDDPDKAPNVPATPMITVEAITYAEEQWDQIRTVFRDELDLDADQTWRQITPVIHKTLRSCIELAVSPYYFQSAVTSRRRHRAELSALRKDSKNWRASIFDAFTVQVGRKGGLFTEMLLPGVDADMLPSTDDYFTKLLRNLDRQIEQAGQRGDNARKPDRDQCWSELLAIWCEFGGKATGKAAARFLIAASKPVMGSAVPDITSVMRWLERRQNKTAKKTKPVRRRATR